MKWMAFFSVIFLALGASKADDKKESTDDQKKVQGKWEMLEGEQNGEKFPEDFVKGFKLSFDGEKYDAKLADGSGEDGTFKLDPKENPRSMTFTTGANDVRKAIYKWDGENLKLCVSDRGGEKPKEFAGKEGNLLIVLKKAK